MIKVFNYGNNDVTFTNENGVVMVNSTQMAKPFNKNAYRYFQNPSTFEYIVTYLEHKLLKYNDSALCAVVENEILSKISKNSNRGAIVDLEGLSELYPDVVMFVKGGNLGNITQGIFLCEELALHFAQWLSPKFYFWCNTKIKELLTHGVVTIDNNAETLQHAISVLEDKLESYREDAEYAQQVLKSEDCFTATEVAKGFGLSAMKLNKILRDMKIQFYDRNCWFLYSRYHDRGLTEMRVTPYIDKNGRSRSYRTMVWTEKGIKYIQKRLKNKEVIK